MRDSMCAVAALALGAPATHADGLAYWLTKVTTDDGDRIVEAGETADVTLTLLMDPNDPAINALISAAIFDCVGDESAYQGEILDWTIHHSLDELTGDLTTTDGVSLFGVTAGQVCGINSFWTFDNPVDIITFEWAPVRAGTYEVTYTISADRGVVHVFEYFDDVYQGDVVMYPVAKATVEFNVNVCPADANADGTLDILDFVAFQQLWIALDPAADCDANDRFDVLDFICFQQLFIEGCD